MCDGTGRRVRRQQVEAWATLPACRGRVASSRIGKAVDTSAIFQGSKCGAGLNLSSGSFAKIKCPLEYNELNTVKWLCNLLHVRAVSELGSFFVR